MDDTTTPAAWTDGHPQLEAIAAAVWERCGRSDSGVCVEDDPRTIAVAALGAVLPPADRGAVLREAADAVFALEYDVMVGEEGDENLGSMREAWDVGTIHATQLLRHMADATATTETQPATLSPAERTMLDYALNQAQLRMWDTGKYTAEEQAALVSLRRLTAEQPAAGARQDETAPRSTQPRPCRVFVSGGTVWCCEEGETDCPCVCHQPAVGARQDEAQP